MFNKENLYQQLQRLAKYQLVQECYSTNGIIEFKDITGKCVFQVVETKFDTWLGEALMILNEPNIELSDDMVKLACVLTKYMNDQA